MKVGKYCWKWVKLVKKGGDCKKCVKLVESMWNWLKVVGFGREWLKVGTFCWQ